MKRGFLLMVMVFSSMLTTYAQDESYSLNLHFDKGVNAVLKMEDFGSRSYATLIADEVGEMEILRWEQKGKMLIYYCREVTIYINAANMRFTFSYNGTNLNGDWELIQ